jgi:hypothetical protein
MYLRSVLVGVSLLLLIAKCAKAEQVTVVMHAHFDRDNASLTFKPLGRTASTIDLALNDVVEISVKSEFGSRPITIDRWAATEKWTEEKKRGKKTIKTEFFLPREEDVHGQLGSQIAIVAAFSDSAIDKIALQLGEPIKHTVGKVNSSLSFSGTVKTEPPILNLTRGTEWHVAPHQVDLGNDDQHWFTISIKIKR